MTQAARQQADETDDAPARRGEITPYDFRTGTELSREAMWQLAARAERLAGALGRIASAYLNCRAHFTVADTVACSLDDFLARAPRHSPVAVVPLAVRVPPILWALGPELVGPVVNTMLGGTPDPIDRAATTLETALLKRFFAEMVDICASTWDRLAELRPKVGTVVTDTAALQGRGAQGETLMFRLEAEIAGVAGEMHVCLPVVSAQRLVGDASPAAAEREQIDDARLRCFGEHVVVPVSVIVEGGPMPMAEVLALGVGDVIPLGKPVGEPMTVAVRGRPKFLAETGVVGGRLAARLLGPCPAGRRR